MLYWVLELARVFGLDGVTWITSASFKVTVDALCGCAVIVTFIAAGI